MKKLKEMYNNGMAKLCGLHAAAYLIVTEMGAKAAHAYDNNILNPYNLLSPIYSPFANGKGNYSAPLSSSEEKLVSGIALFVPSAITYVLSDEFSKNRIANGGSSREAVRDSITIYSITAAPTIVAATSFYGWKGGVIAAAAHAAAFGLGFFTGTRQGNEIRQQREAEKQR